VSDLKLAIQIAAADAASAVLQKVQSAVNALAGASEKLNATGAKLKDWGGSLTEVGEKSAAMIEGLLGPTSEVDAAMLKLRQTAEVTMGPSGLEGGLQKSQEAAVAWSKVHVGSAADYVASTQSMVAVLLDYDAAQAGAAVAMQLATATGTGAAEATKGLLGVYQQLGDPTKDAASEMQHLADVMTATQKTFQLENIAALPEALAKASPAAKMAGVDVSQLAVSIGALEKAGLKGEGAGAALAGAMQQMGAASKSLGFDIVKTADGGTDFLATLNNLHAKVGDVSQLSPEMAAKLQQAFGPGNEAVLKLIDNSQGLRDQLEAVKDSTGATARASEAFEQSGAGAAQLFEQQLAAVKMQLATGIMPALGKVLPLISSAASAIGDFAGAHPQLTALGGSVMVAVAAFGMIGGPIISAVGSVMSFAGALSGAASSALSFGSTLLANPITWIAAAIAAAIFIIWKWDEIVPFFQGLWEKVKATFTRVWTAITAYLSTIDWGALGQRIVSRLVAVWQAFNPLTLWRRVLGAVAAWLNSVDWSAVGQRIVDTLIEGWNTVSAWIKTIDLQALGKRIVDGIGAWFHGLDLKAEAVSLLKDFWSVWQAINLTAVWKAAWSALVAWWHTADLKVVAQNVLNGIIAVWGAFSLSWLMQPAWDALVAWFGSLSLADAASLIIDGVMGVFGLFDPVGAISGALDSAYDYVANFSLADAGENIIQTLVDGMMAMAGAPAEAMEGIVTDMREYLPFSPAKRGPLMDLHRIKLVQTIADTIVPGPIVAAMDATMHAAMGPLAEPGAFMPRIVGETGGVPTASGASATQDARPLEVTFNLVGAGTSAVAELEAWIANPTNAKKLAAAVDRVKARQAATAY
jgi:TP901 family phage tail tape measure protein